MGCCIASAFATTNTSYDPTILMHTYMTMVTLYNVTGSEKIASLFSNFDIFQTLISRQCSEVILDKLQVQTGTITKGSALCQLLHDHEYTPTSVDEFLLHSCQRCARLPLQCVKSAVRRQRASAAYFIFKW